MASSYSSDLQLELMVTGEKSGLWGDITNTNLTILQQAIAGYEAISIAGGVQTTALTFSNGLVSNGKNAVIKLTGTITGNQTVTIPDSIEKTYIIENGTTGAFTVQFKTVSGTGPTWSTTDKGIKILFSDGTNVVDVNADLSASTFASISSGAISSGQIDILAQAELRLQDTTGGQYVGFKAPGTVSSSYTLTLPTATGTANQILKTDGSGVLSFTDPFTGIAWQSVQTTGFTASAGNAYPCNTTSTGFTVTLPATPSAGDQVQLVDYAGTFDTNALVIDPNGEDIEGSVSDLQLEGERSGVILTYIDSTQGWIATSGINEGTDALSPGPYSVDFLVVAGGGATSLNRSGGGGAGGYRTSTQTVNPGTAITVTVGDGGTGTGGALTSAQDGSNSSISGSGLTTITSTGGGGAGQATGRNGGSGGGASTAQAPNVYPGGLGNTPSTAPSQGNNGGAAIAPHTSGAGAGGGGAGAVGSNNASGNTGGNGGNGTASSITGSSVTYAGGGGGGGSSGGSNTTGGTGGGGAGKAGVPSTQVAGDNGTANTGGGGGGGSDYLSSGVTQSSGGKGVVILSVPTARYSSTTTGSPTVTTSGSNTIMKFNGSGSYTS
jgi:hypothetical protein